MCRDSDQDVVIALRIDDRRARNHTDAAAAESIAPKVLDARCPEPERAFGKHDDFATLPRGPQDRGNEVTLPLERTVAAEALPQLQIDAPEALGHGWRRP